MTDADRPNFLFLFPDQHRPDWLGVNDDLPLRTPNLDRLAGEGVRFTRAVTPSPLCAPARACLARGQGYPCSGVVDNGQDYPLEEPTCYQRLREAGYRVGGVGKFDLAKATLDWNLDGSRCLDAWGFTDGVDNEGKLDGSISYRRAGGPKGPYLKMLADRGLAETYCREHAERGASHDAYTTAVGEDAYCDNWLSENALAVLGDIPVGEPWFLQVNFTGPHNPMDVTPRMRERWKDVELPPPVDSDDPDVEGVLRARQNYAAMIENIDRQVGRFIDAVRERGELDRTVIVFSSDHGEMLGDHGRWGKSTWRQPAVGVPLIVSLPGGRRGVVCDALVQMYDLAATFLELAGVEPLAGMDSRSLVDLLSGSTPTHRDVLISGLGDWRLAWDGRFKLVRRAGEPPILFDTQHDPDENYDIADTAPREIERLSAALDANTT